MASRRRLARPFPVTHFTMSRKLKKGYYVRGQFVAEGSELDLAYKAELKGTDAASKTELKRESTELQDVGEALLTLRAGLMAPLELPEKLMDALAEAKRITNFEGRRRQMQFIGKLMRLLQASDPDKLEAIKAALAEQHSGTAAAAQTLHQAEQWRDRLIGVEDAFAEWLQAHPATDSQQLRALIRQARKDAQTQATPDRPGETQRHGRAYREIFQLVREQLDQTSDDESAD